MSDTESRTIDILLPEARVSVFSDDADTIAAVDVMRDDWRFARVNVQAVTGDVQTAIEECQANGSPDLIIIQTETIDDSFTARLGELSQYCDEGTAAIIIGPVNDVYLYRQMIEMGVSDYLVRPVKKDVFTEVIAKTLVSRLGVSNSRLIAFTGAKGGTGVSVFALIAAVISAEQFGNKTALLDFAGGWSSLSIGAGFDPTGTLAEASKAVDKGNQAALDRILSKTGDKLSILSSGLDAMLDPLIDAQQAERLLDNLMATYPVVFVDLSSTTAEIKKMVIAKAQKQFLFTTPTLSSLRSCRTLIKEITQIRGEQASEMLSLVVNRQGQDKANEVPKEDIQVALETSVAATIPNNTPLFLRHESEVKSLLTDKECEAVLSSFLPLLKKVLGVTEKSGSKQEKNSGVLGGFLSKLKAK